jgi:hypothetical protein
VSPKCELDDPAPNFFVTRPVELRDALHFVTFLGHFEGRAVNIVTVRSERARNVFRLGKNFLFSPKIPDGLWDPPRLPITRTGNSLSRSKSTGGLKPTAHVRAMRD